MDAHEGKLHSKVPSLKIVNRGSHTLRYWKAAHLVTLKKISLKKTVEGVFFNKETTQRESCKSEKLRVSLLENVMTLT